MMPTATEIIHEVEFKDAIAYHENCDDGL